MESLSLGSHMFELNWHLMENYTSAQREYPKINKHSYMELPVIYIDAVMISQVNVSKV